MRCSSGSREALNWKSLWTLTAIDSLWTSMPLLFSLMGVASVQSRLQTRFAIKTYLRCFIVSTNDIQTSLSCFVLWLENISCCSWKWKMGMKSTPCFIRQVVLLSELSDDVSAVLWIELVWLRARLMHIMHKLLSTSIWYSCCSWRTL
jgi:hypothetical protein